MADDVRDCIDAIDDEETEKAKDIFEHTTEENKLNIIFNLLLEIHSNQFD